MENTTAIQLMLQQELEQKYPTKNLKSLQEEITQKFSLIFNISKLLQETDKLKPKIGEFSPKVNNLILLKPSLSEIVKTEKWQTTKTSATTLYNESKQLNATLKGLQTNWQNYWDEIQKVNDSLQSEVNNLTNKLNPQQTHLDKQKILVQAMPETNWKTKHEKEMIDLAQGLLDDMKQQLTNINRILENYVPIMKNAIEEITKLLSQAASLAQSLQDFLQELLNTQKKFLADRGPQKTATQAPNSTEAKTGLPSKESQFGSNSPAFHKQPSPMKKGEKKEDTNEESPHP